MDIIKNIDRAVCLVYDKRIDTWPALKTDFEKVGVDVEPFITLSEEKRDGVDYNHVFIHKKPPFFIDGCAYGPWYSPSGYNIYLCQRQVIQQSIDREDETLMLIEDDCLVKDDFLEIIDKISPFFDSHNWDMIYLGAFNGFEPAVRVHENIARLAGSFSFHCVIIKKSMFKKILMHGACGPMDWICATKIHSKHNCYAITPSIVIQQAGYSYGEGAYRDYSDAELSNIIEQEEL